MQKQLYRSRKNKMISGVCGGIAEYFNIDPAIVRLGWVLISFTYGIGILAYIIAIIIVPEEKDVTDGNLDNSNFQNNDYHNNDDEGTSNEDKKNNKPVSVFDPEKGRFIVGAGLVFLGIFLLTRDYFGWFYNRYFWPLLFIFVGLLIIYKSRGK